MRKSILIAGLILAVGVLAPAAALGKPGGTDRPTKLTTSGSITRDLPSETWVSDTTGQMSHLGKITLHAQGTFAPAGSVLAINGTTTIVAANGDELSGTLEGTSTHPEAGELTATFAIDVTGGTGRFKHASGTLNVVSTGAIVTFDAVTLITQDEFAGQGKISYPVCEKAVDKVEKAQKKLQQAHGKKAKEKAERQFKRAKDQKKKVC